MHKKLLTQIIQNSHPVWSKCVGVGQSHLERGASVFPGGTLFKRSSLCLKSWRGNPKKTGHLLVLVLYLWERGQFFEEGKQDCILQPGSCPVIESPFELRTLYAIQMFRALCVSHFALCIYGARRCRFSQPLIENIKQVKISENTHTLSFVFLLLCLP